MFAECNGKKTIKDLKKIVYKNYPAVFMTNSNFNLRTKMYSTSLKDNDVLSELILKKNSSVDMDKQYTDCYVLLLGMMPTNTKKMCTMS